jgi:predicted DNA-binding transcriptional regulator AlpA
MERLLRTAEVASRLGLHPETIRRNSEELGVVRLNQRVHRYRPEAVAAWLAQRAVKGGQVQS